MDFSAFLIIPLAAVVAAAVVLAGHWATSIGERSFVISLTLSFLLGILILLPWEAVAGDEWQFLALSLGLVVLWAAAGTVVGMAIGLLLVKLGMAIASALRR